jgi:homogentisate 1,2-dioxygenase
MAFMFESCYMVGVTDLGIKVGQKIHDGYNSESWMLLQPHFMAPDGYEKIVAR